ncbi:hypothetical protein [Nitrobacter hamburgensis]|uniref:hypothetical protein n=1 Tax=Nitrobacter hamburgensis TaxID=912 RepID=UPI0012EE5DA0|nr:hypothetical protein [Nitrobacter hamburgensis]
MPVRVKKTRQIKIMEPASDFIRSENAPSQQIGAVDRNAESRGSFKHMKSAPAAMAGAFDNLTRLMKTVAITTSTAMR